MPTVLVCFSCLSKVKYTMKKIFVPSIKTIAFTFKAFFCWLIVLKIFRNVCEKGANISHKSKHTFCITHQEKCEFNWMHFASIFKVFCIDQYNLLNLIYNLLQFHWNDFLNFAFLLIMKVPSLCGLAKNSKTFKSGWFWNFCNLQGLS